MEALTLSVDSTARNENPLLSSRSYTSIIFDSQQTLKKLELNSSGQETAGNDLRVQQHAASGLNLPNLEVLRLFSPDSTLSLFADLYAKRLQELKICGFESKTEDTFNDLANILKGQSATLVTLDINFGDVFGYQPPGPFTFKRLRKLHVRGSDDSFVEWMSHNHYPKLVSVPRYWSKSMDLYHKFKPNAPHLKAPKRK